MAPSPSGPLAGLRVVEIDAIGPVPLAAMIMADMGADIVRICRRDRSGQDGRRDVGGAVLNRSREHVALDLKTSADRDALSNRGKRRLGLNKYADTGQDRVALISQRNSKPNSNSEYCQNGDHNKAYKRFCDHHGYQPRYGFEIDFENFRSQN